MSEPTVNQPYRCEDCGLTYAEGYGGPATARSYTCDDCGGYVESAAEHGRTLRVMEGDTDA